MLTWRDIARLAEQGDQHTALEVEKTDDDHSAGGRVEPEAGDHVFSATLEIVRVGDVALEILEQIFECSSRDLVDGQTDRLDVQNECAHTDSNPAARAASCTGCNACRPVASAI